MIERSNGGCVVCWQPGTDTVSSWFTLHETAEVHYIHTNTWDKNFTFLLLMPQELKPHNTFGAKTIIIWKVQLSPDLEHFIEKHIFKSQTVLKSKYTSKQFSDFCVAQNTMYFLIKFCRYVDHISIYNPVLEIWFFEAQNIIFFFFFSYSLLHMEPWTKTTHHTIVIILIQYSSSDGSLTKFLYGSSSSPRYLTRPEAWKSYVGLLQNSEEDLFPFCSQVVFYCTTELVWSASCIFCMWRSDLSLRGWIIRCGIELDKDFTVQKTIMVCISLKWYICNQLQTYNNHLRRTSSRLSPCFSCAFFTMCSILVFSNNQCK
jgi:hypothetical protein